LLSNEFTIEFVRRAPKGGGGGGAGTAVVMGGSRGNLKDPAGKNDHFPVVEDTHGERVARLLFAANAGERGSRTPSPIDAKRRHADQGGTVNTNRMRGQEEGGEREGEESHY